MRRRTRESDARSAPSSPAVVVARREEGRLTYSLGDTAWCARDCDPAYPRALDLLEDRLAANRPLILLWCERNGIPHVEASALDGRGVDEAVGHLIRIGVEELGAREAEEEEGGGDDGDFNDERDGEDGDDGGAHPRNGDSERPLPEPQATDKASDAAKPNRSDATDTTASEGSQAASVAACGTDHSQYYFLYQPRERDRLDLFARYSPKDEQRCSFFKCWLSAFAQCRR